MSQLKTTMHIYYWSHFPRVRGLGVASLGGPEGVVRCWGWGGGQLQASDCLGLNNGFPGQLSHMSGKLAGKKEAIMSCMT